MNRRNFLKLSALGVSMPLVAKAEQLLPKQSWEGLYVEVELFGKRWPVPVREGPKGTIKAMGDLVITVEKDGIVPQYTTMYLGNVWPEIQAFGKRSMHMTLLDGYYGAGGDVHAGDTLTIAWPGAAAEIS